MSIVPLSRRQFLQLAGIALFHTHLINFPVPTLHSSYGRTLQAVPVRVRPDYTDDVIAHLWPDSIVSISPVQNNWYATQAGFVPKEAVQPVLIQPTTQPFFPSTIPFWAEVLAPCAAVRQWCAADAPLITRIGNGGVLQVIDQLTGTPHWYGVADERGELLGWSQASAWQPVKHQAIDLPLAIILQARKQIMTIGTSGHTILEAHVACGEELPAGTYTVERHHVSGIRAGSFYGAPWPLKVGDHWTLTGAYWHNQFGVPTPGPAVQTTTYLARWLYEHCGPDSHMIVL